MQRLQDIFKDANFHDLEDVLNMINSEEKAKEWDQSHYAADSTADSTSDST